MDLIEFEPLPGLGFQDYLVGQSSYGMLSTDAELHQKKRLPLHELQFQFLHQREGQHMTRLQVSSYGDPS